MLAFRPLFDAHVEVAEIRSLGRTPLGERRVIPIVGGSFRGERLGGRVLPGGADWQTIGDDGAARLDARYTLEAEGGALVQVRSQGLRHGPPRSWPGSPPARLWTRPATTSGPCCASRRARRPSTG